MTIKCLHDLKPGDVVAFKSYIHGSWYRDEVLTITSRSIVIKGEPELKFKKTDGLSTRKEDADAGCQIVIVTPEIQEDWDRREYQKLIQDALRNEASDVSIELLKKAVITLTVQGEYSKRAYTRYLKEILSTGAASSEALKNALQLLQDTPNQ